MEILLIILIEVLIFVLLRSLFSKVIKPISGKQRERVKKEDFYKNVHKKSFKETFVSLSRKLPVIGISDDSAILLQNKINRLNLETDLKSLRKLQLLYFITVLSLGMVLSIILGSFIFVLSFFMAIYAWMYPMSKIDKAIKQRNLAIEAELPKLFSILYYVYKRTPNADLRGKIQSYIKTSGPDFFKEMQIVLNDMQHGDAYALRQFKKRVPIPIVMRFCDIIENRILGYDNTSVMENFKSELDRKLMIRSEELLKSTDAKAKSFLFLGVGIPFGLLVVVYFTAQIMQSFNR